MQNPKASDKSPSPPASWGAPWWHYEDVYVQSTRLGEGSTWFHWSPTTDGWRHRTPPRTGAVPPPSEPGLSLQLREGVVTLKAGGIAQPLPFGDIKSAVRHPRRPWVALVGSSNRHPPQPAVWDLAQQRFLTPLYEAAAPHAESLRWQSLDGFELHGLFYPSERPEAPLCILVHDGPIKAARAGWPDKACALRAAGAHTFYVNYRGSEGLAVPGPQALKGVWGKKDVWDLVSAKNHLLATRRITSKRFAIWGGRAGGFGVLNAVARYPNAFDVAIAVYPLLDPVAAARRMSRPETLAAWRDLMGERASPLSMSKLAAPKTRVHVYHGEEDAEVPYEDVEAWVHKRREDGWNITLMGYEGMGARFTQIDQWRHYHREAVGMIVGESRETLD